MTVYKTKSNLILFPNLKVNKYEQYILKTINTIKKDIKESLVSFFNIHNDDYIDDLNFLFDNIKSKISLNEDILISDLISIGRATLIFSRSQIIASLRGLISINKVTDIKNIGVDIFASGNNNLLKSWVSTNTKLITSIARNLLDDVANIIETGFRAGNTISSIQEQIKIRFNVSDKKANLIASDQIAKLHSNYIRQECLNLGLPEYIWRTSNDERVRASHALLNDKICRWDDPTVYKNTPQETVWLKKSDLKSNKGIKAPECQVGEDFRCRCTFYILVDF
jgi:SPP1 gp7 family putative phage head morphogenesis protein